VTLECEPELAGLLAQVPGVERVVARGDDPPDCDFQVALPDLPRLLGLAADTLPPMPRLSPPIPPPPRRPGAALRIGLVWSSRPGPPLDALLALAALPGVALVGLRQGPGAADLAALGAESFIADAGRACADFTELATVIAGLDVVVGGDGAPLHLAAAMAKPAFALVPLAADWRWPEGRETNPWYPTMRLFPQEADGSWIRPLGRLTRALAALAAALGG